MTMTKLPKPHCKYGYTQDQLTEILGERRDEFDEWMHGQTVALCCVQDGHPCPSEHGLVVYPHDLERFLAGGVCVD